MTGEGGDPGVQELLDEQLAYYRARAGEYDEWFLRRGRYDRGPARNRAWFDEVETVRERLRAEQSALPDAAAVLELACGTGLWTERLTLRAGSLTAVDASPEVLALNRERLRDVDLPGGVEYVQADLFAWRPARRYDFVFFGFWLSHVPPARFEAFWQLVGDALAPGGRVFFVDNLVPSTGAAALVAPGPDARTLRELNDGRRFEIVKVFYDPPQLETRLARLGFAVRVEATPSYFLHGSGGRA
jgi:demethylmenaquinone methyltransferase/2-methoxy-6-polyprenyl-1,4-benzoquinol methylase